MQSIIDRPWSNNIAFSTVVLDSFVKQQIGIIQKLMWWSSWMKTGKKSYFLNRRNFVWSSHFVYSLYIQLFLCDFTISIMWHMFVQVYRKRFGSYILLFGSQSFFVLSLRWYLRLCKLYWSYWYPGNAIVAGTRVVNGVILVSRIVYDEQLFCKSYFLYFDDFWVIPQNQSRRENLFSQTCFLKCLSQLQFQYSMFIILSVVRPTFFAMNDFAFWEVMKRLRSRSYQLSSFQKISSQSMLILTPHN